LKTRLNKEIISLEQKKQKLFLLHPKNRLANNKDRLVFIKKEIYRLIEKNLNKNKYLFEILKDKLEVLSPLSCLSRGYSITRKLPERVIIRSSESLAEKDKIEILLGKGKVKGIVEKID
jgi:exodeoxyribonuclease VII large subunit